jgi:hypothetical protein
LRPLVLREGEQGHFELGDAVEAPAAIDEGLDEGEFQETNGLEFGEEAVEKSLVFGGVVGGKEDGAAGESCFDGVKRNGYFSLNGGRPGRVLGVGSVGSEAGFGDWLGRHVNGLLVYGKRKSSRRVRTNAGELDCKVAGEGAKTNVG